MQGRPRRLPIRVRPLVLIVEDDRENLLAYEEVLKRDGFRRRRRVAEAGG